MWGLSTSERTYGSARWQTLDGKALENDELKRLHRIP